MLSHPSCSGFTGISRKNKMCHVFPLPKLVITMLHLGKWGLNIARSNPVQEYKQCGVRHAQTNQTSNNKITHIDIITKTLVRQLGFRSIHFICFVGREHTFRQSWREWYLARWWRTTSTFRLTFRKHSRLEKYF